jgi:membrane-associated phospholipid phosphatase
MLPNMDHVFAQLDQQIFGCQPALLFAQGWSHPVFSELMHLGYASYFFLIALVTVFYFLFRYQDFARASFVIVASFFAYYLIFIFLPVTGPQYYYLAIGLDQVAQGIFPQVGDYFATHQQPLPLPGYSDGLFYHMVENAHSVGERPTAAFPSSHVGITTILMLLAWQARSRTLLLTLLPFFLLMCLSTVYIQAHYVVDVFGGLVSAVLFYVMLNGIYTYIIKHSKTL